MSSSRCRACIWRALIAAPASPRNAACAYQFMVRSKSCATLAVSLVRDGRKAEGERIVQDWLARHPDFNACGILAIMRDGSPPFVEGRDRLVASARGRLALRAAQMLGMAPLSRAARTAFVCSRA